MEAAVRTLLNLAGIRAKALLRAMLLDQAEPRLLTNWKRSEALEVPAFAEDLRPDSRVAVSSR